MAFDLKNLSVLAYANGFTLWHYKTPDAPANAARPGYFNDAKETFHVGDMVLANLGFGTTAARNGVFAVVSVEKDRDVDLANLTPFGSAPDVLVAAQEAA
jgi:hypothetical protein